MLLKQKNSLVQGNIGLVIAMTYFASLGCYVSVPLNDIQEYDLVVDFDKKDMGLKKIQVKTTTFIENGKYKVNLRTSGKGFQNNTSDYLFVVDGNFTQYFIPRNEITARSAIVLGDNYSRYIIEGVPSVYKV